MDKIRLELTIPLEGGKELKHIFSNEVTISTLDVQRVHKFIDWVTPIIKFWVETNLEKLQYATELQTMGYLNRAESIYLLSKGNAPIFAIADELAKIDGKIIGNKDERVA